MSTRTEANVVQSIKWEGDRVLLLDQTRLPQDTKFIEIDTVEAMHEAIQKLRIRGAPAIGIAAAYGLYLGIRSFETDDFEQFWQKTRETADYLSTARPTAVNLDWALNQLKDGIQNRNNNPIPEIKSWVLRYARQMHEEDKKICKEIGENGVSLVSDQANILTHCNTGSLATGKYGTAMSVIYHAHDSGLRPHVWVDETRPLLQGSRLTTWELLRADIPCTLITDSTAGSLMRQNRVDLVVVGTDRVAANGDVANKIGTYPLAVLASQHGIPFYVAAPLSSIDLQLTSGDDIPIEERSGREITHIEDHPIAPEEVSTYSPAFDITPSRYVSGFITEAGIVTENYNATFRQLKRQKGSKKSQKKENT